MAARSSLITFKALDERTGLKQHHELRNMTAASTGVL